MRSVLCSSSCDRQPLAGRGVASTKRRRATGRRKKHKNDSDSGSGEEEDIGNEEYENGEEEAVLKRMKNAPRRRLEPML